MINLYFCPISKTQMKHQLIYVSYGDGEHGATVDLQHYLKKCRFLMENRIQTCFPDRTSCKIHRGCVLMDKYTQVVSWSKIIVQKYDIICFRGNVYCTQSQNTTANFNFSCHVQFLHALFT